MLTLTMANTGKLLEAIRRVLLDLARLSYTMTVQRGGLFHSQFTEQETGAERLHVPRSLSY